MVRFKYRYLVVEARQKHASVQLSRDGLSDSIKASIQENFGDYGSGVLLSTYQSAFGSPLCAPLTMEAEFSSAAHSPHFCACHCFQFPFLDLG